MNHGGGQMNDAAWIADAAFAASVLASIVGAIPPIAGILGIIWYGLMIYDWIKAHRKEPPHVE